MVCKYGNNGFWNSRIAVEGGFSIMVDYSLYEEKKFNKFKNKEINALNKHSLRKVLSLRKLRKFFFLYIGLKNRIILIFITNLFHRFVFLFYRE